MVSTGFSVQHSCDDLIRVVDAVFRTTMGLDVTPGAVPGGNEAGRWRAAISFRGFWNGALLLELGDRQASQFTRIMLPWHPDVPAEIDIRDAVGELANMLAGNWKSILPGGMSLSSPVVADRAAEAYLTAGGTTVMTLGFVSIFGPFSLSVIEIPA